MALANRGAILALTRWGYNRSISQSDCQIVNIKLAVATVGGQSWVSLAGLEQPVGGIESSLECRHANYL